MKMKINTHTLNFKIISHMCVWTILCLIHNRYDNQKGNYLNTATVCFCMLMGFSSYIDISMACNVDAIM